MGFFDFLKYEYVCYHDKRNEFLRVSILFCIYRIAEISNGFCDLITEYHNPVPDTVSPGQSLMPPNSTMLV